MRFVQLATSKLSDTEEASSNSGDEGDCGGVGEGVVSCASEPAAAGAVPYLLFPLIPPLDLAHVGPAVALARPLSMPVGLPTALLSGVGCGIVSREATGVGASGCGVVSREDAGVGVSGCGVVSREATGVGFSILRSRLPRVNGTAWGNMSLDVRTSVVPQAAAVNAELHLRDSRKNAHHTA